MLASFTRPETSKHLYFNLNNSLHLADPMFSPTYKVAGLYAIFKNDICYYVGQSKNVPSRLSTHLTGKYESCDLVKVYFIDEDGFSDFYERSKDSQKAILENNESYLISELKPIENIMVDSDAKVNKDVLFSTFQEDIDNELAPSEDISIYIDEFNLTLTSDEMFFFENLDPRLKRNAYELEKAINGEKTNGKS